MPINVFLAYVDTYIGKQLLGQFEHKPTLFSVHGCVWDAKNIEALIEQHRLLAGNHRESFCSDTTKTRFSGQARSEPEIESMKFSMQGKSAAPNSLISCSFFSRRDGAAVQKALRECEWIVVEQREAQDVFEILHILQNQPDSSYMSSLNYEDLRSSGGVSYSSFFQKPKKFVLLSNFMTWFSTPPLCALLSQSNSEADYTHDLHQEEFASSKLEDNEEEIEIDAPYPPIPDVDKVPLLSESDGDNDGELENEDQELDNSIDKKEILTEDQYNRRVPHIKYFNWRDAEKAVAGAHCAHGLPLYTFVIFAGLTYGEGEDTLEPFFRQAWNATMDGQNDKENPTLPIFGTGEQHVPMIHVKDLATFTRKLLCCPRELLPLQRYFFATDSDTQLSWREIVKAINQAFGGVCTLKTVKPSDASLYDKIEHFTIDLCLERGAIKKIMETADEDTVLEENMRGKWDVNSRNGKESGSNAGTVATLWIADGGFKRNIKKISLEFRVARDVQPKRVVILGPPLSGKSYLGTLLASHYKIPAFRIENIVDAFREHLGSCKKKLEGYRADLIRSEEKRRLEIKTNRLRHAARLRKRGKMLVGEDEMTEADNDQQMDVEEKELVEKSGKLEPDNSTGAKNAQFEHTRGTPAAIEDDEAASDLEPACWLSSDEVREMKEAIDEIIANSPFVERCRNKIAQMERILLMRLRQSAVSPVDDLANATATSRRTLNKSNLSKRRLAKEQQRRKQEEELQQAKEALQDAPFQDEGLALMVRWRLARPDCRNQGYILIGFPQNMQQARYSFGNTPLIPPVTEEEALNPRSATLLQSVGTDNEAELSEAAKQISWSQELSSEDRLPDDVVVLYADDEYLLKRWNALPGLNSVNNRICSDGSPVTGISYMFPLSDDGIQLPGAQGRSAMSFPSMMAGEVKKKTIDAFNRELKEFKLTFGSNFDATLSPTRRSSSAMAITSPNGQSSYDMLNYLECAVTVPTPTTAGGRRIRVHKINVQKEPLVAPPAPNSKYELPPSSSLEFIVRQKLGSPHYFGKTPEEVHQEAVRRVRLEEEQMRAKKHAEEVARNREQRAYEEELTARRSSNEHSLAIQASDRAALEVRKLPLRKFLMKQVVPLLSKGLVEVCRRRPENPTEYLAEWLLRHNPHDELFSDL